MASGWTTRGAYNTLLATYEATSIPGTGFAVFLATNADPPTAGDNLKTDVTEIATTNGYDAGGINVNRDSTDFDVETETAPTHALVQIKDIVWTASGGPIPASGNGARWFILTDRNATVGSREMWAFFDLVSDRSISDGQTLTIQNAELRLTV